MYIIYINLYRYCAIMRSCIVINRMYKTVYYYYFIEFFLNFFKSGGFLGLVRGDCICCIRLKSNLVCIIAIFVSSRFSNFVISFHVVPITLPTELNINNFYLNILLIPLDEPTHDKLNACSFRPFNTI